MGVKHILAFIVLVTGYYTFTYAISLWRDDKNKLGAFGVVLVFLVGTIVPIFVLYTR